VVNDLVIDLLADFSGEFLNGSLEDTFILEPLPSAVVVGNFRVVDVVFPTYIVGGVAKTTPCISSVAPVGNFLAVDLCGEIAGIVLLDCHSEKRFKG
jgi:hypothetical protein